MFRKDLYAKIKDFVNGRSAGIIFALILITFISTIVVFIPMVIVLFKGVADYQFAQAFGDYSSFNGILIRTYSIMAIVTIITSMLISVLSASLSTSIFKAYKNDEYVGIVTMFSEFKENGVKFLTASLAIFVVNLVAMPIMIIPIVGQVVLFYVVYSMSFVFMLIADGRSDGAFSAVKDSFNLSKGHRWNLFVMDINYGLRAFGVYFATIIVGIGFFSQSSTEIIGALIVIAGMIATIVIAIKYIPHTLSIRPVYYEELCKREEDLEG